MVATDVPLSHLLNITPPCYHTPSCGAPVHGAYHRGTLDTTSPYKSTPGSKVITGVCVHACYTVHTAVYCTLLAAAVRTRIRGHVHSGTAAVVRTHAQHNKMTQHRTWNHGTNRTTTHRTRQNHILLDTRPLSPHVSANVFPSKPKNELVTTGNVVMLLLSTRS